MLSYQTVNSHTLELLKKLTNEEFLSKARLVGGTALALQYGHRISIDLDFFGNIEEDNETIKEVLINIGKLSVIKESKNIKIYILDDIKIDFVNYRYNWLDPAIEENGISHVSIITSNFHLMRVICLANSMEIQVTFYSSKSPLNYFINSVIKELIAVLSLKYYRVRKVVILLFMFDLMATAFL